MENIETFPAGSLLTESRSYPAAQERGGSAGAVLGATDPAENVYTRGSKVALQMYKEQLINKMHFVTHREYPQTTYFTYFIMFFCLTHFVCFFVWFNCFAKVFLVLLVLYTTLNYQRNWLRTYEACQHSDTYLHHLRLRPSRGLA